MPRRPTTRARLSTFAVASVLLAACAGTATGGTAGQLAAGVAQPDAARVAPPDQVHQASADDAGEATGIHVTGAWEVVVRDPGGTVAFETEFHNDLTDGGRRALAAFFGFPGASLEWLRVGVDYDSTLCDAAAELNCQFTTTTDAASGTAILETSIEATVDGEIASVHTWARVLTGGNGTFTTTMTTRDLDPPVQFVAGQTVDITVTLSFS